MEKKRLKGHKWSGGNLTWDEMQGVRSGNKKARDAVRKAGGREHKKAVTKATGSELEGKKAYNRMLKAAGHRSYSHDDATTDPITRKKIKHVSTDSKGKQTVSSGMPPRNKDPKRGK